MAKGNHGTGNKGKFFQLKAETLPSPFPSVLIHDLKADSSIRLCCAPPSITINKLWSGINCKCQ